MTCGSDASDKGGAFRFEGCGKSFDWASAPPYKARAAFLAPATPAALKVADEGSHRPVPRLCLQCGDVDVQGSCFDCISCTADAAAFEKRAQEMSDEIFWSEHRAEWNKFKKAMKGLPVQQLRSVFKETMKALPGEQEAQDTVQPTSFCWPCMRAVLGGIAPPPPVGAAASSSSFSSFSVGARWGGALGCTLHPSCLVDLSVGGGRILAGSYAVGHCAVAGFASRRHMLTTC